MPKEGIVSIKTRSSLKRKKEQLISNAPIKKARIEMMKQLATKFKKSKLNKDKVTYFNESCPDSPDITNIVSNDNSITTSATSTPQSTPTGEKKIDPLISRISTSLTALLVKLCAPS